VTRNLDRRSFIKWLAVAGAVVLSPFFRASQLNAALAAPQAVGFRFIHAESVAIILDFAKSADRYDVTVRRDGEDVATFRNVSSAKFGSLASSDFDVEYFDPLAA